MISAQALARRAAQHILDPLNNPLKQITKRPVLGLLNDIPADKFREDEARCWARAGFQFAIQDAEHSLCMYGRNLNSTLLRLGITPIQRLPRDAGSAFGDALTLGARGVMRPYAQTVQEVADFLKHVTYPPLGIRGAYPPRDGAGALMNDMKNWMAHEEANAVPWLQFETPEILEESTRGPALDALARRQGVAFIGTLDIAARGGSDNIHLLYSEAVLREVPVGGIFYAHEEDHDVAVQKLQLVHNAGARYIVAPIFATDMPMHGALRAARPFHMAFDTSCDNES